MESIKCINNSGYEIYLTIGKMYESDPSDTMSDYEMRSSHSRKKLTDNLISIKDDRGYKHYVPKRLFITIQDDRHIKLKQLGV